MQMSNLLIYCQSCSLINFSATDKTDYKLCTHVHNKYTRSIYLSLSGVGTPVTLALTQLTTCRTLPNPPAPLPIKSGQIVILVQKDAQCYETYEKNKSDFC